MNSKHIKVVDTLASKVIDTFGKSTNEVEKNCWMIVHEYHHGAMPTEYDIREVDEELYLAVLERVKAQP